MFNICLFAGLGVAYLFYINSKDLTKRLNLEESSLIQMKINHAVEKDFPLITAKLDALIKEFGVSPYTLSLITVQANFEAF